jgi:hypothetical protein
MNLAGDDGLSGGASRGWSRLHIVDPTPEPFGMFGCHPADRSAHLIFRLALSHLGPQGSKRVDGGKEGWRVKLSPLPHLPISEARRSPTRKLVGRGGALWAARCWW